MKKQIFILVFIVVATFSSIDKSFGQAVAGSVPRSLSCTDDALHPFAGKEYIYTVSPTPSGGQYTWWATKDASFISTALGITTTNLATTLLKSPTTTTPGTDLTSTSASYGITTASDNVKITWSSSILAGTSYQGTVGTKTPTFIAVQYTPPSGSGCADNFKVYELDPKNGFTVDILNLDATKMPIGVGAAVYDQNVNQCFANVSSAKYSAGKMDYQYGINTLYFEVVASNFSASWTPTFKLTGLDTKQTALIEWDYTKAFAVPKAVASSIASPTSVITNSSNTSSGVSIYVRVTITNNSFEGLSNETIRLAVDGTNASNELDVVNSTCSTPAAADFADYAEQILKTRPTVIEGTSSLIPTNTGIVPKNP